MSRTISLVTLSAAGLLALPLAVSVTWAATPAAKPAAAPAAPPAIGAPLPPAVQAPAASAQVKELEWEDLLPEQERKDYAPGPAAPTHDYLSGESGLAAQQVMNFNTNAKLDGQTVKLPGFIVPLELDAEGKVTEFFLVPYFGACIHVPPPPANQMVFVTLKKGVQLETMYAAFWVVGKMSAKGKSTRLGAAAYSIAATALEEYKY